MMDFFKKMTEWMLDREEDLAKKCAINLEDLEKQIAKVEEKKEQLKKQCEENDKELERILTKLKWIKSEELKCQMERNGQSGKEG